MSASIPTPLLAAAGLAAATIDEARRLPTRLVGLPVVAVSTALQASLKVQQRYADLVVRGDTLIGQLRPEPDEAPAWARFDEDEPPVAEDTFDDADVPAPPIAGYDELTVPQLRGRLRLLSQAQVVELLTHEEAARARPAFLTMLGNRLETLRTRG